MKVLVIEDEIKTARALARLIQEVSPDAHVPDILQSVKSAVDWLGRNGNPDIIFLDIQLADGLSFEIFEKVEITAPVIFCTAFNEYAIQAFRNNGIAYILKPFDVKDIEQALNKVKKLKDYFQKDSLPAEQVSRVLRSLAAEETKKSFLVYNHNAYINIPTSSIAYFYKGMSGINLVTDEKKRFGINESLDEIHRLVGKQSFYRINRQYLVAFRCITEVQHYFDRKLLVKLNIETDEKLVVGREKAAEFLDWLGNR
ncbi:two component transcriptional regulator, LytTR family [Chitinophaga terrae (ex Kim and Jung 2007)]|uniref:Two component transcriptional regulator, LytTR family n=1 Tax=Chitinophaga terrae (ex Kim and Jung 2007) TaxID=408074 RepID=A0A1H4ETT9_9BACT|nr:LytTR family DNA-binding domain-containing protein [Chitinophaga terrae (ex Kim and Jung 2007)]GEP91859.1 DNA-binding response regulator [Chitinophaga terrae (ex Kim and Jung 2007)]SEA88444.1 two component transcriptional regulator, LytTR family [Chitinophaga terrae (ex Kim and Jung 2007)]